MIVDVFKVRQTRDGYRFAWGLNSKNELVTFLLKASQAWVARELRAGEYVKLEVDPYSWISVRSRSRVAERRAA